MKQQIDNLEQILELLDSGKTREEILAQFGGDRDVLNMIDEISAIDAQVKPHPAILQKAIDAANAQHSVSKSNMHRSFFSLKFFAVAGSFALVAALGVYASIVGVPNFSINSHPTTQVALRDDGDDLSAQFSELSELESTQITDTEISDDLLAFADSLNTDSSEFDPNQDTATYEQIDAQMQEDFASFEKDSAELASMSPDTQDNFDTEFDELIS